MSEPHTLDLTDEDILETRRLYPNNHPIRKMIRKALTSPLSDEMQRAISLATSLAFKASEIEGSMAARDRQKLSAAARKTNLAERDRLICSEYAKRNSGGRQCSVGKLHQYFKNGTIKVPKKLRKLMWHNRRLLSVERMRLIVSNT